MPGLFDHVLLTRFNLASAGVEGLIRARDGWLKRRVELFERYCLPSVLAQQSQDFHWLVYFDAQSPAWLRQAMQVHVEAGAFSAAWVDSVSTARLHADLRDVLGPIRPHLLTTNLDNDDALARDFVSRVQRARPTGEPQAIFLTEGLVRAGDRLYAVHDPANAFCSVLEPWAGAQTCWVDWHTLLPQRMPTRTVDDGPGWLQVVHGANVSNRVRGRLVHPMVAAGRFVGLDDIPVPRRSEILQDRLLRGPGRTARSMFFSVGKKIILRTIGKAGLGRIKLALARRSGRGSDPQGLP